MATPLSDIGLVPDPTRPQVPDVDTHRDELPRPDPKIAIAGAVLFFIAAIVLAAIGSPGWLVVMSAAIGVCFIIFYAWWREEEIDEHYKDLVKETEAHELRRDEMAQRIQEAMRGAVKVRCRYCGALNEGRDEKCESCGVPL